MKILKLSCLALAIGAVASQAAVAGQQQEAKGFIEDSSLQLINRNFYMNRDYRHGGSNSQGINRAKPVNERNGYREEWAHGAQLNFSSGFTQGTVGVGADAFAYGGVKLDSGRGRVGNGLLPISNNRTADAEVPDSYGQIGGAVKLRASSTELKYGEMRPTAPVFATGDARLLPETATGFQISSSEFDALSFEAGHFTSINRRNSTNSDDDLTSEYAEVEARSVDFAGLSYAVNDDLSLMFYASEAKDVWRQYFANLNYNIPLTDSQALNFDLVAYKTRDEGEARAGELDTLTWSLKGAYSFGAHKLSLAYQKVRGDEFFDYIGGDSIWLANSVQYSDFNAPNERSVQIRYDLNMKHYGVPGLTFMARYIKGDDIDGTKADPNGAFAGWAGEDEKHWERDLEARYVFQEGAAKDLSLRLRHATHRSTAFDDDLDEVRLIIEYPLSIL
ncbi:OprD family porin [Pseudomonas chengduensis]|jgi:imipenem/basic amino acid-specific outer membrane pore|nr:MULTISPECIES: OprD family porin [Pseudomonas]MBG0844047.1 OprD family porin [Pseudomonas chengduensis]WFS19950.1 OprD family porin [Pseudomonas sp. 905_Psudmo1]